MTVQQRMQAAQAAYHRGDLREAMAQAKAALVLQPRNSSILQFAGVVACQNDDPETGAAFLRRAIETGAKGDDILINLANALVATGQLEEALAAVPADDADASDDIRQMHANILKLLDRPSEAIWLYERIVSERPDNFDAWNNLGNARHQTGDLDGALDAFDRARTINAVSSLVHINIARVLVSKDRHQDACFMLEKAAQLAPADPEPRLELGRLLISLDHPEAALRALGDAARLDPKNFRTFIAIGLAFIDLSNQPQAERALKFGLHAAPREAEPYFQLGLLLEKANRLDDLKKLLSMAEQNGIDDDAVRYVEALADYRRGNVEAALATVQNCQSSLIDPATKAHFTGLMYDRMGLTDSAFDAFREMNDVMAQSPLGIAQDRSAYQRTIAGLAVRTTQAWRDTWLESQPADGLRSPVFLVGFPRSGTTLLDTFLMGHSDVQMFEEVPALATVSRAAGDLDEIARMRSDQIGECRRLYFDELAKHQQVESGKLVVDKNPLSMILLPLINRLFPDARIILALRHPHDVVLSCFMQNFKPTEAMSSFLDLDNASRTYDTIFSYWEQCVGILPVDTCQIRYEDVITDPETAIRPVFDFLRLDWQASALDHQRTARARGYIRTPSYAQVTEKLYKSASGRWRQYEAHMQEAFPVLAKWVTHFGYDGA